jgi:hypothetical protein
MQSIFRFSAAENLLRAQSTPAIEVFDYIALPVFRPDPGNLLPALVACDEGHFICEVHMPVNSCDRSGFGISAADIDEHLGLP